MRALDLFAGAGGLSLGLMQAGVTVVASVEWDADSCATYRANVGDHMIHADIHSIDAAALPDCDIVCGGPPCQGFSQAGKKDENDPRNQLWREFVRIVAAKRPTWVLMENVRAILRSKECPLIVGAFAELGYTVRPILLNAVDYGVPQSRYRVFFIGNNLGLPIPMPTPTTQDQARKRGKRVPAQLGFMEVPTVRKALFGANGGSPSPTIRAGAHGAPGYSPRHQAGYIDVADDIERRLDAPANAILNAGRHGRPGSVKHPGHFVPVLTERTDHGVLDLDSPSCVIKAGGHFDASGHMGGACVPSLPCEELDAPSATINCMDGGVVTSPRTRHAGYVPNVPLDSPSPTIQGGGSETGGTEPVRHRLKNRYAEHGEGATFDQSAPTVSADRGLEEHWLASEYEVAPTIQTDSRVSRPCHHGPDEPRMMYRRLTPRECAMLQSFPPDFEFSGTKTSQHRQIGNAVPVGLARAIGLAILELDARKD